MKWAAGVILVLSLAACGRPALSTSRPATSPTSDQSQADAPTKQVQQLLLDRLAACEATARRSATPGGHWTWQSLADSAGC